MRVFNRGKKTIPVPFKHVFQLSCCWRQPVRYPGSMLVVLGAMALTGITLGGCASAALDDTSNGMGQPTVLSANDEGNALSPTQTTRVSATGAQVNDQRTETGDAQFVAEGARQSDVFPRFGPIPPVAASQMSEQERIALEVRMTQRLRAQTTDPEQRKIHEARLVELRALAANHASDTQNAIENP